VASARSAGFTCHHLARRRYVCPAANPEGLERPALLNVREIPLRHSWATDAVYLVRDFRGAEALVLPRRRSPRATRRFETEKQARDFARAKFNEGLTVYAGTINPHLPRQLIPSKSIPSWLGQAEEKENAEPDGAQEQKSSRRNCNLHNSSTMPKPAS
jgi:hypothetical protein